VLQCPNHNCITTADEPVESAFTVLDDGVRCEYCDTIIRENLPAHILANQKLNFTVVRKSLRDFRDDVRALVEVESIDGCLISAIRGLKRGYRTVGTTAEPFLSPFAAHAADVERPRGRTGLGRRALEARYAFDWSEQFDLALDPERARSYHDQTLPGDNYKEARFCF